MKFLLLVSCCMFMLGDGFSQGQITLKHVSCPEKTWAIFHPFIARKAFEITKSVVVVHDSVRLLNILNAQQLNALKHSYWTAALYKEIGKRKSLRLAKAHEKGNYIQYKRNSKEDGEIPDKISSEMDMFNNVAGIKIAETNRNQNNKTILDAIIKSVLNGEMKVIKTNSLGQFLRSDNTVIERSRLSGKWENEKSLVNSDYRSIY